jgi:hypothetical protein
MRERYVAAALFVLSAVVIAQDTSVQSAKAHSPKLQNPAIAKRNLTEQQKQGLSLLQSAEAAAGGMETPSRIVADMQIAQVYRATDKKKALELTERSYEHARTLQSNSSSDENERRVEQQLQEQVVDQYILLSPEKVDTLLDQMPAELRTHALQSLLPYYWKSKNTERPVAVLMQLALETEMEYNIATHVIENLPQHPEQVRELFVAALTSYQNHEHRGVSSGGFTETIAAAYGHVPDQLITSAIDEVLSQAKQADEKTQNKSIQMRSGLKDAVEFQSYYDLQLFSVLSVLQQVDPEKAERLLNERRDVRTFASKYPEGVGSLRRSGLFSLSVNAGQSATGVPGSSEALEQQRSNQIVESSAAHPNDAMANAALLSPQFALQAYMGIARENEKKNAVAASMALRKAQDLLPQVPVFEQIHTVSDIIYSYEQLGDKDAARSAISDGVKTAAALYKQDGDASDPNTAPEAYWVSTKVWRNLIRAAYELDPNIAVSLLREAPDDQLRVFAEIALASRLLGSKMDTYDVAMSVHKQGGAWTMFSAPSDENEQEKK